MTIQGFRFYDWQIEHVAYQMYRRNVEEYGADEGLVLTAWATDPEIQTFWIKQATGVLEDLQRLPAEPTT